MLSSTTKSQVLSTGEMPAAVTLNGIPFWQAQNGRTFPLVAGAEDPPPADSQNDDEQADAFDKDRALATIRKLRENEKANKDALRAARAAVAAAEAKDKDRADADKTELEKAQIRVAALEAGHKDATERLKRVLIAQAIERAAVKLNARNPEVIAKLIDASALELDDSGTPTNADDLVKALLKAEPYLVATEQPAERNGVPATPRSSGQPGQAEKVAGKQKLLAESGNYAEL